MADIIAHYGGGGTPKPGEERCATVSYTCGACGRHVSPWCERCRHCGERFDGVDVAGGDRLTEIERIEMTGNRGRYGTDWVFVDEGGR